MLALRSRCKKLYLGFCIILCIIFLLYYAGNKNTHRILTRNIKKYIKPKLRPWNKGVKVYNNTVRVLQPLFQSVSKKIDSNEELLIILAQEAKCPACFGVELCEEISTGYIKLLNSEPTALIGDLLLFSGTLGSVQKVSLLVPRPDVLGNFDQLVCPNTKPTQWVARCKSPLDAENPFLLSTKQFVDIKSIKSMREKLFLNPPSVVSLTCLTIRLKDIYIKAFDTNDDHRLDIEEGNIFHTTLTLMPHLVNLKVIATIGILNTFPQVVGTCGRVLVTKGEMNPLSLMLNDPFTRRASIAVQLLNLVQEFLENDELWLVFEPNWRLDNLHVNEKGEVFLSSLSEMYLIEKRSQEDSKPCTWECVKSLRQRLRSNSSRCFSQQEAMHLMYSEICVKILSNMKQHKFNDYFERESSSRIEYRSWPGLLHDTPSQDRIQVEKFLATCVDEMKPGERQEAFVDLQDLLSDIVDDSFDESVLQEEEEIDDDIVGNENIKKQMGARDHL